MLVQGEQTTASLPRLELLPCSVTRFSKEQSETCHPEVGLEAAFDLGDFIILLSGKTCCLFISTTILQ